MGRRYALLGCSLLVAAAQGQVLLTGTSPTYSQNFNNLPNSGENNWTASWMPGWYVNQTKITASTGSSNAGGLYSFGQTFASDRALGSIASNTTATITYAVVFRNNTGLPISSVSIRYTGEQWRNAGNVGTQSLTVGYGVFNDLTSAVAATTSTSLTSVPSATFTSLIQSAPPGDLNGNLAANRATVNTSTAVTIPTNQFLVLQWTDVNDSGSDHGLAIDDFTFSATTQSLPNEPVPEPGTLALGAAGLYAAIQRRRRRTSPESVA